MKKKGLLILLNLELNGKSRDGCNDKILNYNM